MAGWGQLRESKQLCICIHCKFTCFSHWEHYKLYTPTIWSTLCQPSCFLILSYNLYTQQDILGQSPAWWAGAWQQRRKQRQQRPGHAAAPAFLKGSPPSHLCTCLATRLVLKLEMFFVICYKGIILNMNCMTMYIHDDVHEWTPIEWLHAFSCVCMWYVAAICNSLQANKLLGKSHETGKVSAHHVAEHTG